MNLPEHPYRIFCDKRIDLIRALLRADYPKLAIIERRRVENWIKEIVVAQISECDLTGAEAASFLSSIQQKLAQYLVDTTSGYPPQQWLWYSRRLCLALRLERIDKSFDTLAQVVETASRFNTQALERFDIAPNGDFIFPLDQTILRRLIRARTLAKALGKFWHFITCVALGETCKISKCGDISVIPTQHTSDAISFYCRRLHADRRAFPLLGTCLDIDFETDTPEKDHVTRLFSIAQYEAAQPAFFPEEPDSYSENNKGGTKTLMQFVLTSGSLEEIARVHHFGGNWLTPTAQAHLFCQTWLQPLCCPTRREVYKLFQYGYLTVPEEYFFDIGNRWFDDAKNKFEEVIPNSQLPNKLSDLLNLLNCSPDLSGLYGKVIFIDGGRVMVDFWALNQDTQILSQYPKGDGNFANARSGDFENQVQTIINSSGWSPDTALKALVGRKLRLRGRYLTDIDAAGCNNGIALLVSCKSVIPTIHYAQDHKMLRNYGDAISDAVLQWEGFAKLIASEPVGDNFDLSIYDRVIPVVCTPVQVLLPIGHCTRFVEKGLRAAVSAGELLEWLTDKKWYELMVFK